MQHFANFLIISKANNLQQQETDQAVHVIHHAFLPFPLLLLHRLSYAVHRPVAAVAAAAASVIIINPCAARG